MAEFDYIRWLRERTPVHPRALVGPGDDCAVVSSNAAPWLVKTDMLLDGVHFRLAEAGPRRVGRKAMGVNLSDIAAMGGKPVAAVVSVALPRPVKHVAQLSNLPANLAEELYAGLRDHADAFDTAIVGGDTNSWDSGLVISVALLGEPGPQGPILRSGAKSGDWLMITGPVGGSILGKHLDFTPRIREALALQGHCRVHAMLDISDGLAADVNHICEESGCGAVLVAERIPISDAAHRMNDANTPLEHALGDGEDFELVFAVTPEDGRRLLENQPIGGITLAWIGECVQSGLFLEENGVRRPLAPVGFVHSI